ncbi:hypothetical protein PR202_gb22546 [Eleusine coracana subsp. coracana]|uniref:Uncharacterized protein n=1 Tax=Eleusine coracana subsp. coracana TaxID=191504 RepID=A0AAV5FI14_ELECO|nr:hypothetical protein PR202_gb22546 [Eleusine coracana subsp. coracana]
MTFVLATTARPRPSPPPPRSVGSHTPPPSPRRAPCSPRRTRTFASARTLSRAFFLDAEAPAPFAAGGARFPEGDLYVCVDLLPFGPALQAVQRALMQVAVKDADHGSYDCYFDTVRHVMWLLVGDEADGHVTCGSIVVFGRDKFESAFALEWVN